MRAILHFLRRLANSPLLLGPLLFILGALGAALPTLRTGLILPQEYDEFAYQLGADTFLQGRLTNPPHPLAPFFETMHELQTPTYASKYPPGQSLQLAAGEWLGHPIYGVWLTIGLLAVAATWMLRAVAPATWAAAGGLLVAWQWGALTYWGRTYWGGGLFALAGVLVFGGAIRFWKKPSAVAIGWASVGAGLLALTRPYEGLWFCAVPAALLSWRWWQWKPVEGDRKLGVAVAAVVPVLIAMWFLLIYNKAVTGSAREFPHRLYQQQAEPDVGVFVWDHPEAAPPKRNPELTYQIRRFNPQVILQPSISAGEVLKSHGQAALPTLGGFFLPGLLGVAAAWALFSGQAWRRTTGRMALASVATLFMMLGTLRFFGFTHYAAAWAAPVAVLIMLGCRGLYALHWPGRKMTPWLLAVALLGWAGWTMASQTLRGSPPKPWALDRYETIGELEQKSVEDHRGHVVFVMMAEGQPAFAEWVYNGPDIDAQTVIFARSLGPARDAEVAWYYPTRHLWQAWLKPTGELDHLAPYQPPALPAK